MCSLALGPGDRTPLAPRTRATSPDISLRLLYGTPIIMPHACVRTLLTSRWVPRWFSDAAVLQHVYIIL